MPPEIGLIDYEMGNLQSVMNSCEYLGKKVKLIRKDDDFKGLTHVILPGVGAFRQGMDNLRRNALDACIRRRVAEKKINLLGICLGMQLLAVSGTEGCMGEAWEGDGLGLIPGRVERFRDTDLRIPHIGWNEARATKSNPLLPEDQPVNYYFVHSYFFNVTYKADVLAVCDYGISFACVVGRDNVFGVQFHPEKSHRPGLELLNNFFKVPCLKNA